MQRFFRAEVKFFLGFWFLLLITGRTSLFSDPGTFWHTVLGEQMLQGRQLIRQDTLTFSYAGERWLALQWIGELLMAVAYRIGGFDTQLLLAVTTISATFTWLAIRFLRIGFHPILTLIVLMLVFSASSHHFHVRPHLATIVGMVLTMGVLVDVESGKASLQRLWWLVPLFAIWTNIHGGVMAGLATVYLAACGWSVAVMLGWPSPVNSIRAISTLTAVLLALTASLLVNPYGSEMPRQWLSIMSMNLPEMIDEHAPLRWNRTETWMVTALAAFYVRVLFSANWRRPRVTWLLPFVWLFLAFSRVRHAPLFAGVTAVALADVLPMTQLALWFKERGLLVGDHSASPSNEPRATLWFVPTAAVCIALLLQGTGIAVPILGRHWAAHDPSRWPIQLLPELKRLEASAEHHGKIFNSLGFGGFLEFHTPRMKPFIDDRCELFGDFLGQYVEAESRTPDRMQEWADRNDIRYALVQRGSPFDNYLKMSDRWLLKDSDQAASLYEARRP